MVLHLILSIVAMAECGTWGDRWRTGRGQQAHLLVEEGGWDLHSPGGAQGLQSSSCTAVLTLKPQGDSLISCSRCRLQEGVRPACSP